MYLDERAVNRTVNELRQRSLVRAVQQSGSRVLRFCHLMVQSMNLYGARRSTMCMVRSMNRDGRELATMCVLMLRGPQTAGEIKGRTNRLFDFPDLEKVESTLESLMLRQTPLVARTA